MKIKLVLKIIFLVICLFMAYGIMRATSSDEFKEQLNSMFTAESETIDWCPEHVVDFEWKDKTNKNGRINDWINQDVQTIKKNFCKVGMSRINSPPKPDIGFKPLLIANSAEAKSNLLEWNEDFKIFRIQSIIFKSQSLEALLFKAPDKKN